MSHSAYDDDRTQEAAASAIRMYSPGAEDTQATIKQLELDMVRAVLPQFLVVFSNRWRQHALIEKMNLVFRRHMLAAVCTT
jgi:hypothetical protein